MKYEAGQWRMGAERDAVILQYFTTLFTSLGHQNHLAVLDTIMHKVDEQMNTQLTMNFYDEEISMAVKQMHSTKALGLD